MEMIKGKAYLVGHKNCCAVCPNSPHVVQALKRDQDCSGGWCCKCVNEKGLPIFHAGDEKHIPLPPGADVTCICEITAYGRVDNPKCPECHPEHPVDEVKEKNVKRGMDFLNPEYEKWMKEIHTAVGMRFALPKHCWVYEVTLKLLEFKHFVARDEVNGCFYCPLCKKVMATDLQLEDDRFSAIWTALHESCG